MNLLRKVEKELAAESDRHVDMVFRSVLIALKRHEGWGKKRLERFNDEMNKVFSQIHDNDISIVQLLDEETGIELQNGDGKHWYDLPYLNAEKWDGKPPTVTQAIYIRQQQKKWLKPQLIAAILLTMHRMYGWSTERDLRLMQQMEDIENEADKNAKKLEKMLNDECGLTLNHHGKNNVMIDYVKS